MRTTLRYLGNKRFAYLTVFMAASGFMFSAFFSPKFSGYHLHIAVVGLSLAGLFFLMEFSSVWYSEGFAKRGEEIEGKMAKLKLMTEHSREKAIWTQNKVECPLILNLYC